MANKIKYGLKSVYYAKATIAANGSATYETPVAWPGAVNLSLSPEGDTTPFYADNIVYYMSSANNGYTGTLETALVPDSFKQDILGEIVSRNGLQVESANTESGHFALLFQFEGDESATRHVIYNCVASRPNLEGATKESAIAPQTESVDITAATIYVAALEPHGDVVKAKADSESAAYADFFTAVTIPTVQ